MTDTNGLIRAAGGPRPKDDLVVRLKLSVHQLCRDAAAEIERLRADAARLDWLDANWHSAFVAKTERGYLPWISESGYQPTLRAAIDAAREKP